LELSCTPAALIPPWVAYAAESADCVVSADCSADCAWPEPPQPAAQLSLLDWVWSRFWSVLASLDAVDVAELSRDWTLAPEVFTFSPCCSALASDDASCVVELSWFDAWAWPEPPQPASQLLLLDWSCAEVWSVDASLVADESALLLLLCVAELGGSTNDTGALVFTPFCVASASEYALWSVEAYCVLSWAWPEPPHPAEQLPLVDWVWSLLWVVEASLEALDVAELLLLCVAELALPAKSPPLTVTGTFALTPCCVAVAVLEASCVVSALWSDDCAWPEPPQPTPQLELLVCDCGPFWVVSAELDASELAELLSVCVAELLPATTSPPATMTGTFALTPFCVAVADESADWSVLAVWLLSCACPEPPQPAWQLLLLDWLWDELWSVDAVLDAEESAELLLFCVAELVPLVTLPPAIVTGTFALTACWSAFAVESAVWLVDASWLDDCACPEPPQPTWQLELLVCDCVAFWLVLAVLDADELAALFKFCEAELEPLAGTAPTVVVPTDTPSPLTVTGTFALTAFWVALALELALCVVSEDCESCWAWPDPPQPAVQAGLAADWSWPAPWEVLPLLEPWEEDDEAFVWPAELDATADAIGPPITSAATLAPRAMKRRALI
jgi:hypothetical protein